MFAVCVHYATHTKNCGNNVELHISYFRNYMQ